jgi:hypothetical protein
MPRKKIEPKIHRFATPADVVKNAQHHGVTLYVPKDRDVIVAYPSQRLTEELKQGIREHKPALIRDILMRQAMEYLNQRYVEGADLNVLNGPEDEIERTYPADVPLSEFRKAVRGYVEAGINEFRRVRGM